MPRASGSAKIDPLMAAFNGIVPMAIDPLSAQPSATRILGLVSLITAELGCLNFCFRCSSQPNSTSRVQSSGLARFLVRPDIAQTLPGKRFTDAGSQYRVARVSQKRPHSRRRRALRMIAPHFSRSATRNTARCSGVFRSGAAGSAPSARLVGPSMRSVMPTLPA